MKDQINEVKRNCFWTLNNIRNFGHYLTEDLRKCLVKSLVLSKIDYCNALYIGISTSVLKKLQHVIENSLRFIYNIRDWSTDLKPFYKKSHILPIQLRINYKLCLLVHKSLNGTAPKYLQSLLKLYCEDDSKKSLRFHSDTRMLLRPNLRDTPSHRRCFSFNAPIVWNELPHKLRHTQSTDIFKKDLKTHYFLQIDNY